LSKLIALKELSLENNPFSKEKVTSLRFVLKYMSFVKLLDGKTPTLMEEELSDENE